MSTQTKNGKAFEYACLIAMYNLLSFSQDVEIQVTPQLETAKNFFFGQGNLSINQDLPNTV